MPRFRLSPQAEQDIEAILAWSHEQFGERIRFRYEELLTQAILDLADDPRRVGAQERPELTDGAFTYHLRHSRDHVSRSIGRIHKPRHLLLYRIALAWKSPACFTIVWTWHNTFRLITDPMSDDQIGDRLGCARSGGGIGDRHLRCAAEPVPVSSSALVLHPNANR